MKKDQFLELHRQVLRRIAPSAMEKRKVEKIVATLKSRLRCEARKLNLQIEPMLVGSIAKDTAIKPLDIDIFIQFPPVTSREKLERYGLLLGKKILPRGMTKYAEHPYVTGKYCGYEVDIVPCYKISSPSGRLSAVDRTPFHTEYIRKKFHASQRNEVRLLKQFLRGLGIYGAEAEVEGFSGYLCELLILKYDTFLNFLENVCRQWRKNVIIRWDSIGLQKKFELQPLVVIDPVDPSRNAAAAVSEQNHALLIYAAKAYLQSPSEKFFFPAVLRPISKMELRSELKRRDTKMLALQFPTPDLIPDILYPQVRRCQRQLTQLMTQYEFRPINTKFFVEPETVTIIWELMNDRLPAVKKHYGPFVWHRNTQNFLARWSQNRKTLSAIYIENGRLTVEIKREFVEAAKLFEKRIARLNLGKNLNEIVKSKAIIIPHTKIFSLSPKLLTKFFNRKMPWQV